MRCADLVLRWWLRVALTLLAVLALVRPAAARCDPPREQSPVPAGPDPWIADHLDDLVKLYTHFHTHPELSRDEVETSKRVATELTKAGAAVTTNVGKLGVVGVLKNGDGPVVLVRTDMDALPVVEETGLPYASKVKVRDKAGRDVGVMHACGHDIHMTSFIGTAGWLARASHSLVRHRRLRRPARRRGGRRRPQHAQGRALHPLPQARFRPGAALPAGRARRHRALLLGPHARQLDVGYRHHSRQGGPRRLAAPHDRPDRPGSPRRRRPPDHRQPRNRAGRAGGRDRRLDPRGNQAQHHPR